MRTLDEFVREELPTTHPDRLLKDGEMVTDAVLLYRVVRVDDKGVMTERAEYMASSTCGQLMAKGILCDVQEQWAMDYADRYLDKKDEDDPED